MSTARASPGAGPESEHSALGPGQYRADVDGLRGIAVLMVVAYHAFPGVVTGGFVGVDVFFVISGFLISSILFSRIEQGRFSFADFYDRRIRRIFPALIVVLAAALVFGWIALLAQEYRQLGKHVASGAGFLSNFVLWSEAGYFDDAAEVKPMLHLWSLAIEEQFYLLWPLALTLAWRRRQSFLRLTLGVAAASFLANLWLVRTSPSAAFYLPVTRFWELMIGGALAYRALGSPGGVQKYPNAKAAAGLLLLVVATVWISGSREFPGWRALLPTVGTALLISAGPTAFLNRRLLSDRALVWFGLISYPLYLWHWPLLSFAHIIEGTLPETDIRLIAVVGAVALAWLTYRFVERSLRYRARSRLTAPALLAAMALLAAGGLLTSATDGFAARASARGPNVTAGDLGHDEFHAYLRAHFFPCTPPELSQAAPSWEGIPRCFQSSPAPTKDVALIGDSHAEHLFIGLAEALPQANVVEYIRGSLPVLGNADFRPVFAHVIGDSAVRTVVIAADWSMRASSSTPTLATSLEETVRTLSDAGKTVVLAEDVPSFAFLPRICKASGRFGQGYRCTQDRTDHFPGHEWIRSQLELAAASVARVSVARTVEYLCVPDHCFMAKDGALFYRDNHHLGILGSRYVGGRLAAELPLLGR